MMNPCQCTEIEVGENATHAPSKTRPTPPSAVWTLCSSIPRTRAMPTVKGGGASRMNSRASTLTTLCALSSKDPVRIWGAQTRDGEWNKVLRRGGCSDANIRLFSSQDEEARGTQQAKDRHYSLAPALSGVRPVTRGWMFESRLNLMLS